MGSSTAIAFPERWDSCAVAPLRQPAVGYAGLLRRPRLETGVVRALGDGELVHNAHSQIVRIGYWIAPDAQGNGLATRSVMLLSRWALQSARMDSRRGVAGSPQRRVATGR